MLTSRGSVYAVPLLLAGVTGGLVPAASRDQAGADVAVAAALPASQLSGVAVASARSA